jgi:hypothetical protein
VTIASDSERRKTDSDNLNNTNPNGTTGNGRPEHNPTRNLYEYAKTAAGTFGDIMSTANYNSGTVTPKPRESTSLEKRYGLVTTAIPSGTLASGFGITHPLDRMALTANGNLQRLVSSYYDAPVQVSVDSCHLKDDPDTRQSSSTPQTGRRQTKTWDRVVHLTVHNQVSFHLS